MNYLMFALILFIAVLLHELGHFIAAKYFGIQVDSFNIGMGKKLFGRKIGKTSYNKCLLPLGGSCVLDDKDFNKANPLKQIMVFLAGPLMNLFLVIISIVCLCIIQGRYDIQNMFMLVWNTFVSTISGLGNSILYVLSWKNAAMIENFKVADTILTTTDISTYWMNVMIISYIINMQLFIFNILPIPALDGGQIVLNIPALIKKPLPVKAVNNVNIGFYSVLMVMTVYIMIKDIIVSII